MSLADRIWYGRGVLPWLAAAPLLPLSGLFSALAARRRARLQGSASAPPVPVIIVGGISVGGAGKTPLCVAVLRHLAARGLRPGLISRGYHGHSKGYPLEVTQSTLARECGDEPLLIKRALCDRALVAVDPVRPRGAAFLHRLGAQVIVADDGLQHYALARDLEIAVVDGERLLGNGHCLPAGPLREGPSRLLEVDLLVANGGYYPGATLMELRPGRPRPLGSTA
ncbi:MAG: tetraacyldisaccharide 4'-kinase, partial [Succinivibrionaceae bacterium]|nr:tetraacyldisaccharide 4'-kinase [Succinivibrionaceae bacterium]